MISQLLKVSIVLLIAVACLTGCDRTQRVVVDEVPVALDTGRAAMPVKSIWLIDYPIDGKDAYLAWIAANGPALAAPEEVVRIRSYDNIDPNMSPNRLVEFEFDNFLDAVSYLNRPEVVAVVEELANRTRSAEVHTFLRRSDYAREPEGDWPIKKMYVINYPVGGKQAYLDWVASVADVLAEPATVKAISAYENYYGATPNRLVQFEFSTEADAEAYSELESIQTVEAQFDTYAANWVLLEFELRSDYIRE